MPIINSGVYIASAAQLGPDTVGTEEIAANSVLDDEIGAHTTTKITVPTTKLSGTILEAQIADNAVAIAKIKAGTQGDILYYGASGVAALLAAGTAGYLLKTGGVGANPSWVASAAHQIDTFTANGTYTKPAGAAGVFVRLWGGGASGAKSTGASAGGGGGGGYKEGYFAAADVGATVAVTIGVGGAAKSSAGSGNNGTNTTFGSLLTAEGGKGGTDGNNGPSDGGASGSPYSQLTPLWGARVSGFSVGEPGIYGASGGGADPGVNDSGTDGGASHYGGGGGGSNSSSSGGQGGASILGGQGGNGHATAATAGSQPGGGGGGSGSGGNSGKGGDGKCVVVTMF